MTNDQLIARLERGIVETTEKYRSQGAMIVIGSVAFAGLAALRQLWFLIAICLGLGGGIWFLMRMAVKGSGPEKAAPVLEALKLAPGRVTRILHVTTSDSHGVFVTHWVQVYSDEGRIHVRADDDWPQLVDALSARCPQAEVKR